MGDLSSLDTSKIVCDCGHEESEHNRSGGCLHKNSLEKYDCHCDNYSQRKLRKRGQKVDISNAEDNQLTI